MVLRVGHEECARVVDGEAGRFVEAGDRAGAVGAAFGAGRTREGGRDAAGCAEPAHGVRERIGDVEVAGAIERDAPGHHELRERADGIARAVGAAGDRLHSAIEGDEANGEIRRVGHVEVADVVEGDAARRIKPRERTRAVSAAAHTGETGDGGDGTGGQNPANRRASKIGDEHRAKIIDRQALRGVEAGVAAGAIGGHR